jgi:hypothetical protein
MPNSGAKRLINDPMQHATNSLHRTVNIAKFLKLNVTSCFEAAFELE